jgi:DNA-binding protein H-NS
MRKPRDYDAELKALNEKARQLKDRRLIQLGELVIATGADALAIDLLAGALLTIMETNDAGVVEGWRKRGAAFFQRTARKSQGSNDRSVRGGQANGGAPKPASADTSAA